MAYQLPTRPLTLFSNTEVVPNMDLCDIWTNISETVHAVTKFSMQDIHEVIYMIFQSTSWPLTLDVI